MGDLFSGHPFFEIEFFKITSLRHGGRHENRSHGMDIVFNTGSSSIGPIRRIGVGFLFLRVFHFETPFQNFGFP